MKKNFSYTLLRLLLIIEVISTVFYTSRWYILRVTDDVPETSVSLVVMYHILYAIAHVIFYVSILRRKAWAYYPALAITVLGIIQTTIQFFKPLFVSHPGWNHFSDPYYELILAVYIFGISFDMLLLFLLYGNKHRFLS